MPADLTVVDVVLPSPVRAPCPLPVLVKVKNVGTDAPDRGRFEVTIDLTVRDAPGGHFQETVLPVEGRPLLPGRTVVVSVQVRFPCTSPVTLRATVDGNHQILNNLGSAPYMDVAGLTPIPVPWLVATLRVGISDSAGMVTFEPDGFCPGKPVVAEVTVENNGCSASKATTTEVTLEDARTVPMPIALASQTYLLPALPPGVAHAAMLSFATPSSATGTSGFLAVHVRADSTLANPDQCDRSQLDARREREFSAGNPPQLSLRAGAAGAIRPGEVPSLSWWVRNDCSEIGTADITVLFGAARTELFRTTVTIPLRSTVEADVDPSSVAIPPAVATSFWTLGAKTLEMEVAGSGPDPGPYSISVPLNVVPEPIDATWWTWARPAFTGTWKGAYGVTGSFNNRGLANMTISALSAVEHPTDVTGTAQDKTLPPIGGTVGTLVLPSGSVAGTWSRFQAWTWLAQGTFVEVGPQSRIFSYVANFAVTDAFGNAYPAVSSSAALATVSVPPPKLIHLQTGRTLVGIGLGYLAAAAIVGAVGGPYGWITAIGLAAAGMGLIIAGTFFLYDAYDPPIPDFREDEPAQVDPGAWTIPEPDDERLHALHTLALLMARVASARLRAVRYRDRTWAAYLDGDESKWLRARDDARNELETLRRLVSATSNAADEAHDTFEQLLTELKTVPSPDDLHQMTGRFADELQLTHQERTIIDERAAAVDAQNLRQSVERARSNGLGPISEMVRIIYETTAAEFAEREYLS